MSLCTTRALAVADEPDRRPENRATLLSVGIAHKDEFLDADIAIELAGEWMHDPDRDAVLMELVAERGLRSRQTRVSP